MASEPGKFQVFSKTDQELCNYQFTFLHNKTVINTKYRQLKIQISIAIQVWHP
jgi:hypothetical protein